METDQADTQEFEAPEADMAEAEAAHAEVDAETETLPSLPSNKLTADDWKWWLSIAVPVFTLGLIPDAFPLFFSLAG